MRLNESPHTLLALFEKALGQKKILRYMHSKEVNFSHVLLEQDRSLAYYSRKIAAIFIKCPNRYNYDTLVSWQILETYRVLNTALASTLVKKSVKQDLLVLKKDMEKLPFLKTLLTAIDTGVVQTSAVCSGHGVWYLKDGYVDLEAVDSTVMLVSGEGGGLSDNLAVDIENDLFDPNNVAVIKKENSEEEPSINPYPTFFNRQTPQKLPNLCLVDDDHSLPKPRVIEPLTGRVLYDLQSDPKNKNYFSLATVLQQVKGRVVFWAGCTGVRDVEERRLGAYLDYNWARKDEVVVNKRKTEAEGSSGKSLKVMEEQGQFTSSL
ncbi:DUF6863 domain-containing protein [Legionella maioricensis]|uniref:DUF6863 domain-containing protein n=1 Tax=Legionella maioricensis TaxID=2896528 RepID=A0A9X2CZM1_9GAMM|nr:hypothetical protein [Legionella maioricensis]MCL9683784.1 hypothetical protein [Legionella maioricensis]MCL9686631.1 hypothetical protein [Legionella maioricensis]